MEPTLNDVQELRTKFSQRIQDENKDFHPKDLARVASDDKWLERFLLHHDMDMKEALNMLIDTCEWRKANNVNDITEGNINRDYLNEGLLYVHNRDKDHKSLFIFACRKHVKGQRDMDELKKVVIYWMERIERQDKGDQITLFFDMQDSGLANMDMEYTKYIINLFKLYYPNFLNYILIFEMPWVMNAAFKIIKSWLPSKAVQKIKFVDKKSLKEYVDSSQALKSWGGEDVYEFVFVPETEGKLEENKKKVHFADGSHFVETQNAFGDVKADESPSSKSLTLNPVDAICFSQEGIELSGTLSISNSSDLPLIYKVKTTSPEKFRVRPSCGLLTPGSNAVISVVVLSGYSGANIIRDKFLVMSYALENENYADTDLNVLWKLNADSKKREEHKLRCRVPSIQQSSGVALPPPASPTSEVEQKISQLLISMNHLTECNTKIQSDLHFVQNLVIVVGVLVLFFGILIMVAIRGAEDGHCHAPTAPVLVETPLSPDK